MGALLMLAVCADASGTLSGAAVAAAGVPIVFRYVGIGSSGKRLTVAERDDLWGHGRIVFGIAESTATEADNGAPAGQRDAEAVLTDPAAAGLPFVFMTNDKPGFITADVDYAVAYTSVLGARSADYGFASFLKAVRAAGVGTALHWQAGYPPNLTGTQGWVHFWQRQGTPGNGSDGPATPTTAVIGGVTVDLNNQLLAIPTGGDMNLTDILPNGASVQDALMDGMTGQEGRWTAGATGAWLAEVLPAIVKAVQAGTAQESADHAADLTALSQAQAALLAPILAAIKAQPTGGQVDVTALATSLAPALAKLLPQSTPAQIGAAVEQALAAQFAKP